MKYWKAFVGFVLALAMVACGLYAFNGQFRTWVDDIRQKPGPTKSVTVDAKGGQFTFGDGIFVSVAEGTVTEPTTLSVGGVTKLRSGDKAPFADVRTGAVKFDVSLTRDGQSNIQPKKPLWAVLPLSGNLAGKGRPHVYTPVGGGFTRLPSLPYKDDPSKLWVELPHLSPKYLTYVDDNTLLSSFLPDKVKANRSECKQKATVNGTKVRIGQPQGWSLADDSAIYPCLVTGNGDLRVGIANNIDYMLSVATTSGVEIATSSSGLDEDLVQYIARNVFHDDRVKGYVSGGQKLVGTVNPDNLPATIELRADPSTFLAQSVYISVNFLVGLLTGKSGGEVAGSVQAVLNAKDVVTCLESATKNLGEDPSMMDVMSTTIDCSAAMATALADQFDVWALGRIGWFTDAARGIATTGTTALNGIRLTLNNTMRVVVEREFDLAPYVDEWSGSNGTSLTVKADGSGRYDWRAGPCTDATDSPLCHGHADVKIGVLGRGFKMTYRSIWYTDYSTGDPVTFTSEPVWSVGDSSVFYTRSRYLVASENDWALCRDIGDAPDDALQACNLL